MKTIFPFLKGILKLLIVIAGLAAIYFGLYHAIAKAKFDIHSNRNIAINSSIVDYSISDQPFGDSVSRVKAGEQYFFNMKIQRVVGQPCFVRTSWRWVLHFSPTQSVMWNNFDGEFYTGDKSETLSQTFIAPEDLIPGSYTVSRLASFKCGDMDEYSKAVRSFDLTVEK